jgi:hypothetical protein
LPYKVKQRRSHDTLACLCPLACSPIREPVAGQKPMAGGHTSPGFRSPMYPCVALDTTKIHTPITLGIRRRTKLLVLQFRRRRPRGFDSHRPLHFSLSGVSLRCPRARLSLSPSSHSLDAATTGLRRPNVHSRLIDSVDRAVGLARSPWSPPSVTTPKGRSRRAAFGRACEDTRTHQRSKSRILVSFGV